MSRNVNRYHSGVLLFIALVLAFTTNPASGTTCTIATFADPALGASTPLFNVTFGTSGGWDDSQTGLDLEVPLTGVFFDNAFFKMGPQTYNGNASSGTTDSGTIKFFADWGDPCTAEMYSFDRAQLDPGSFNTDDLFHFNNVQITVMDFSQTLIQKQFSFAFANKTMIDGVEPTATAALTYSAAPEPATVILLGLGSLALIRRRKFVHLAS